MHGSFHALLFVAIAVLNMSLVSAGPVYEKLADFKLTASIPGNGRLCPGPDGYYWGMATSGGANGYGAIYKVKPDGSGRQNVASIYFRHRSSSERHDELTYDGEGFLWGVFSVPDYIDLYGGGVLFKVNAYSGEWTTVKQFTGSGSGLDGDFPLDQLVKDNAGFLWGLTKNGGEFGVGGIYKVNIRTGQFVPVVYFSRTSAPNRGAHPTGSLVDDGAGFFWGTTTEGGTNDLGTVFKVNKATGTLTTLVQFAGSNGSSPNAPLVREGGFFWGTSQFGGTSGKGTVFKVNVATGGLTSVFSFTGTGGSRAGAYPFGPALNAGTGYLIGVTTFGGASDSGTIFKINTVNGSYTLLAQFTGNAGLQPGSRPLAPLLNDGAGSVWGSTSSGGPAGKGSLFRVDTATGAVTLTPFTGTTGDVRGSAPVAGLVNAGNGILLGTTPGGGDASRGTLFSIDRSSGALTTLYSYNRYDSDMSGEMPVGALTGDSKNLLWGVTARGGSMGRDYVFRFNPVTREITTVAEFTGSAAPTYGGLPQAGLVYDGSGYLWGTTQQGGASGNGMGTVFKVEEATGTVTSLAEFTQSSGYYPSAPLVSNGPGSFLGTTIWGASYDGGSVYRVNAAAGTITRLASIPQDNRPALSTLTPDGTGYFWGTTTEGGASNMGTIFRLYPGIGPVNTMIGFTGDAGANRGKKPAGSLVSDGAGFLWGTTIEGGAGDDGTVFKVRASTGALTTIAEFTGGAAAPAGYGPGTTLTVGPSGMLWGTTDSSQYYLAGTFFKINPATGVLTTVGVISYGTLPGTAPLYHHADGHLYGTTADAESIMHYGNGTIYRLRFGPSPVTLVAEVAGSSAALRGTVNPNGVATTASFEWGTDPSLASFEVISAGSAGAGTTPIPITATIASLVSDTTYYYRAAGMNDENVHPQRGLILSFTPHVPSALETWRQTWFGTTVNSGGAADLADYDNDGLVNLLEFAFDQNPGQPASRLLPRAVRNGSDIEIAFDQPAGVSGILYDAEWSSSLLPNSWISVPDTGTPPTHIFRTPVSGHEKLFLRLRVIVQP